MEYLKLKEVADYSELRTNHITIENYITTENMLPNIGGICLTNSIPDCKTAKYYEEHDILLSNIRPYFCKIWYANKCGSASNDILVIKNKKSINSKFLYYVLCDKNFFNYATATSKGTKMPRGTPNAIMNYFVPNIDIKTQNKIASILSAYDDLIEKNNRRMEILRGCAEELYKEWFVRFRFPNWQNTKFINGIPQGWEVKKAKDIFNITIGRTPSRAIFNYFTADKQNNYSWISISDMRDKIFISDTKEYLTQDAIKSCNMPLIAKNTVLLSFKLTVGQVAITTEQTSTNEAIAHFNTQDDTLREYTYLYLKNFNYDELGNTSAIGNAINSTIVKNMKFILPSKELLLKFKENVGNIFDTILLLQNQNELLKQQRDLLLPRLMSGKISLTP